ncbi:unnamed protein product [Protopolystoma xenopodis]|uniref:Uncharacterized protein n=1 Tax=Protopolystoma xenopodis TaxID=117903 RepID=A0A3S5CUA2_9PLAT|nr:unnamed protein product [Protopolystoma xenopodis]
MLTCEWLGDLPEGVTELAFRWYKELNQEEMIPGTQIQAMPILYQTTKKDPNVVKLWTCQAYDAEKNVVHGQATLDLKATATKKNTPIGR